jgi:hypothetical protein
MSGFVVIYRELWDHPSFRNFSEAAAFAWMVSCASWKGGRIRYKDQVINLKRGQIAISVRDLAKRMNVTKDVCGRFLKRLKSETMIETLNETGITIITICNYSKYQDLRDSTATASETVNATPPRHPRDTPATQINKDNNITIEQDISTSLRSVDNDSNSEKQNSKDKKSTIRKNRIVQNQVDGLELDSPTFQQGSDSSGETSLSGGRVAGHGEISAYALKKQKQITRATTLPDDWVMPPEWLEDAKNKRLDLSLPEIDLRLEAEKFKNWGVQNSKKNWHATWMNWILPRETIGKYSQAKTITPFAGAPPSPTEQRIRTADRVREMVLQKFEEERQRDEQGIDRLDYAGNHRGNAGYLPAFEDSAIGNRDGKRAENSDISEVYLPSDSGNNDR